MRTFLLLLSAALAGCQNAPVLEIDLLAGKQLIHQRGGPDPMGTARVRLYYWGHVWRHMAARAHLEYEHISSIPGPDGTLTDNLNTGVTIRFGRTLRVWD